MSNQLSYEELVQQNNELLKRLALMENEMKLKTQEIDFLKHKLFGRSRESYPVNDRQLSLFDNVPDIESSPNLPEEETITYTRKKQKGKKRKVLSQFEEIPVVHQLEDCHCTDCHREMREIGQTKVREELVFIPARLERRVHYAQTYKCEACSSKKATDKIVKAFVPKAPIQNSFGSASIIAETLHQKYDLKVPANRQIKDWKQMGLPIERQHISSWHIQTSQYYFYSIYRLLVAQLRSQEVIHADETTYQMLESSKSKNYFWLFQSGYSEAKQVVLYHFEESRRHEVPKIFLDKFSGYIHSDMYPAYLKLNNVTNVGCFAHVRRRFFEAQPNSDGANSLASHFLLQCDQMFKLEKSWQSLPAKERYELRQEKLAPLMTQFFKELKQYEGQVSAGKLGEAVGYALKHEVYFLNILKDGRLEFSNNRAERSIKELVIGRKNWLFSSSLQGAQATGIILSLKMTAEANGLCAKKYFQYLLEELPSLYYLEKMDKLEAYLPWSEDIQEKCRP